jgi:NitT/TauT family transport system substrate-binding protein
MMRPKYVPRRGRLAAVAAAGILSLTVAACSTSGSSAGAGGTSSASTADTTVSVGVLPIADVAPLYLGMKQGFFAAQHLKVVPHSLQGGAAVASAVLGGSLQFGFGATANLVLANAHGLGIEFVANGDQAAADSGSAWSGILVGANSGITSIAQLKGKTIAANALQGENELALDGILLRNGVQPSAVKVVALPFPTMPTSLASGQVQAVTEVEPFVSAIKAKGGVQLTPLFEGEAPSMTVAGYFADTKLISSNPSLVKRFVTAINESLDYAQAHPAAVRAIIPTYTKITAAVAAKMNLPVWGATLQTSSIQSQQQLMKQLGWMTTIAPLSKLVWSGAKQ